MRDISPNDICPCDTGKKYKKCCRPYHHGVTIPNPTDLLRARYSAYVIRHIDFIMQTTHPESPHIEKENRWRASLEAYTMRTFYEQLEILENDGDSITYRVQMWNMGRDNESFTTRSNFRQHEGKWYYFDDSEIPSPSEESSEA